jgi:hypothetical protein
MRKVSSQAGGEAVRTATLILAGLLTGCGITERPAYQPAPEAEVVEPAKPIGPKPGDPVVYSQEEMRQALEALACGDKCPDEGWRVEPKEAK